MNWFSSSKATPPAARDVISIRMEAIGGQGANSAGKILSDAAVSGSGFSGCHFASFGSEKRGSPVQSFVRFSPSHKPMRSAFFSSSPDLIAVFHEAMLQLHPASLLGAGVSTALVVNSPKSPEVLTLPAGVTLGSIHCVDAGKLSRKERCGINAVMLGAILGAVPEVDLHAAEESLLKHFSRLTDQARARNLAGFHKGYSQVRKAAFRAEQAVLPKPPEPLPRLGWVNAPLGGMVENPGNTVLRDHSLSRLGFAPRFTAAACVQCGYCDMICPDYCFVWDRSGENGSPALQGIDYQFCKGCQKCISICPSNALSLVPESSIPDSEKRHRFPDVDASFLERKWHAVDWNVNYPDDEEEK